MNASKRTSSILFTFLILAFLLFVRPMHTFALPNVVDGSVVFSKIGNYKVLKLWSQSAGALSIDVSIPSGDTVAGAFMGYESEFAADVANDIDTSDIPSLADGQAMKVQAPNGTTYSYGNATNLMVGDVSADPADGNASANQFADITNAVQAAGSGTYTNVSDNVGSSYSDSFIYVILENSSYPLIDIVLTNFCANNSSATGLVTSSIPITLTKPYAPSVGSTGTITTFMGSFDDGDSLSLTYNGGNNTITKAQTPAELGAQFVTGSYTITDASTKLTFALSLQNGNIPPTSSGENISTMMVEVPVSPAYVTYSCLDQNGNIIEASKGLALSSNSWTEPDGTSVPETLGSDGKLVLDGLVGQDFPNFAAPTIKGYSFVKQTTDTPSFKFTVGSSANVTYNYTNVGTVTLHFLNSVTKEAIQTQKVIDGIQLQAFNLTAPTIDNYRINTSQTNMSSLNGTYQAQNTDINLYYDKKTTITINEVDGSKVLGTDTLTGYAFDTFSYNLPAYQYYNFPTQPVLTGSFTNDNQIINVTYNKTAGTLTINYINAQTNKPLLPSTVINNHLGDYELIRVPNINGYTSINTGNETVIQQVVPTQTRDVFYDPNIQKVYVHFVDEKGHRITDSREFTGYYGSLGIIKAPEVRGYQLAKGQASTSTVHYNKDLQTIYFKYEPIQESVTFQFIDDAGHEVYKPHTIYGKYGSNYSYTPPVPWYDHLTYAEQKTITGKYGIEKAVITVHYTRLQAQVDVYAVDDRKNILWEHTFKGYENEEYGVIMPSFQYLQIVNPKLQRFTGRYIAPNTVILVEYKHIPAHLLVNTNVDGVTQYTMQFDGYWGDDFYYPINPVDEPYLVPYPGYDHVNGKFWNIWNTLNENYYYLQTTVYINLYGTDGTYLTTYSQTGEFGQSWEFDLPDVIGDYELADNAVWSGVYGYSDQYFDAYYEEIAPVVQSSSESEKTQSGSDKSKKREKSYSKEKTKNRNKISKKKKTTPSNTYAFGVAMIFTGGMIASALFKRRKKNVQKNRRGNKIWNNFLKNFREGFDNLKPATKENAIVSGKEKGLEKLRDHLSQMSKEGKKVAGFKIEPQLLDGIEGVSKAMGFYGTLLDFANMVPKDGVVNAAVKATVHFEITKKVEEVCVAGGAEVGAALPVGGEIIGGGLGFVVGTIDSSFLNMTFDSAYDAIVEDK